jgi:TolB protein
MRSSVPNIPRTRWIAAGLALAACTLAFSPAAFAQEKEKTNISGTITESGVTVRGIAIPPFKGDAALAKTSEDILDAVKGDLDFSGFFRPVDPSLWAGMDTGATAIDFTAWQAMKADFLVLSTLTKASDQLVLEGLVYDTNAKQMVTGKRIKGPASAPRALGHNLAAAILDQIISNGAGKFCTSQILFTSQVGTTQDIFIADYDGHNLLRLTAMGLLNVTPHISPKGDRIVFTSILKDRQELFLLDRAGRRQKLYGQGEGLNASPKFSPDANTVAFCSSKAGNPDIWSVGIDGKGITRLTNSWAIDTAPAWSPDGSQIAFTSDRSGGPQIYLMGRDGSGPRRLSPEGSGRCDQAAWAPKGDMLAYSSSVKGRYDIMVLDLATGQAQNVTQNPADDYSPSWSPDGHYIAFASNRGGSFQIYIMRANGQGAKCVVRQPNCADPCWF